MGKIKKTTKELNLLFNNVMKFLKNCNITMILFYGSLLGYHRDNSFIDMDDDIDVIVSEIDFNLLLEFIKNKIYMNYNLKVGIKNENILQLFYNDIGPFDIYKFEQHNNDILLKWDGNLLYEKELIFPLSKVNFNNYDIFIPNLTEKILIITYGENWFIPQKKETYNWSKINTVRIASSKKIVNKVKKYKKNKKK